MAQNRASSTPVAPLPTKMCSSLTGMIGATQSSLECSPSGTLLINLTRALINLAEAKNRSAYVKSLGSNANFPSVLKNLTSSSRQRLLSAIPQMTVACIKSPPFYFSPKSPSYCCSKKERIEAAAKLTNSVWILYLIILIV